MSTHPPLAVSALQTAQGGVTVDVLLPYYNGGRFIGEQLESVLNQTLARLRLTILDDGSNEEHRRILYDCTRNETGIRVVRIERNCGIVSGVERLLSMVDAPYFALCDQDDVWDRDKLEVSLNLLERENRDLVYTDLRLVDADRRELASSHLRYSNSPPLRGRCALQLLLKNPVAGCTIVARRELIQRALPFPDKIPMHDRWLAVVAALGRGIGFVDRPTMSYRQHGQNDTGALKFGVRALRERIRRAGGGTGDYLRQRRGGREVLAEHIARTTQRRSERYVAGVFAKYYRVGPLGALLGGLPYTLLTTVVGGRVGIRNILADAALNFAAGMCSPFRREEHRGANLLAPEAGSAGGLAVQVASMNCNVGAAPDFVFVGPSRSASSWIFELLRSHPQVFVPVAKDIYFFDRYYARGRKWYEGFFAAAQPGQVRGEISHDYLANPTALERLAAWYPSVRVMCCLRDPYDRAISSYRFFIRNGLVDSSLREAIARYPEIMEEGLYAKHLAKLFQLFRRGNILVLDFDELSRSPDTTARRIFEFLGVDASFRSPLIGRKVNEAARPRSPFLARVVKIAAVSLRDRGLANLVGVVKRNDYVKRLLYREWTDGDGQEAFEKFPQELIEAYERNISDLAKLLGRSYDSWRRSEATLRSDQPPA